MSFPYNDVVSANKDAIDGRHVVSRIQIFAPSSDISNEAIFFIKPEITSVEGVDLNAILALIIDKFQNYSVKLAAVLVLGSRYLAEYNIIGQHYGVINAISREGINALTNDVRLKLQSEFPDEIRAGATVLGGHQFLSRYPFFTPAALSVLWDALNSGSRRLAPGTYALPINVWSDKNIVLNGFHPHQLDHFQAPNRTIIAFAIRSATPWHTLRDKLVGDTDPTRAEAGSIRQILLERRARLQIPIINKGLNGVHLSAGPLEGMVEIIRFCSDYTSGQIIAPAQTAFGRALLAAGTPDSRIIQLASNPHLTVEGRSGSAFDLTEKLDAVDAASLLSKTTP